VLALGAAPPWRREGSDSSDADRDSADDERHREAVAARRSVSEVGAEDPGEHRTADRFAGGAGDGVDSIPVAMPVSLGSTASTVRLAIEANANPIPTPDSVIAT
jgi:hypothetical protein